MGAPTIRMVARLAGVSVATVSRALKQPDKVSPATRDRVMKAVGTTGYVPNAQARIFRRRTSDTVILLVREISNPFYLEIYKGVEAAADEAGYKVLMGDSRGEDRRIANYVEMVRERRADGLILITGRLPREFAADPGRLPPIVVACEFLRGIDLPTVGIDNVAAAHTAVAHLLGLGHRRIAHVTGPTPEVLSDDRLEGYRAALEEAGIQFDIELVRRGDFSLRSGREATRSLIERRIPFSAIFLGNDEMAVGAINELRVHGYRVPDDVSVVGFDDTMFVDTVEPGLTTIRQPHHEIGRTAMRLMLGRLSGEESPPGRIILPTEMKLRGSTAAFSGALVRK
jgi:LacI family repressor for deo operon, udp, cdd, tsx, nupC, and nupG